MFNRSPNCGQADQVQCGENVFVLSEMFESVWLCDLLNKCTFGESAGRCDLDPGAGTARKGESGDVNEIALMTHARLGAPGSMAKDAASFRGWLLHKTLRIFIYAQCFLLELFNRPARLGIFCCCFTFGERKSASEFLRWVWVTRRLFPVRISFKFKAPAAWIPTERMCAGVWFNIAWSLFVVTGVPQSPACWQRVKLHHASGAVWQRLSLNHLSHHIGSHNFNTRNYKKKFIQIIKKNIYLHGKNNFISFFLILIFDNIKWTKSNFSPRFDLLNNLFYL